MGEDDGAADLLVGVAGIHAQLHVQLHGLVKLGGGGLDDQLHGLVHVILGGAVDELGAVHILFAFLSHCSSSSPLFFHQHAHGAGGAGDHAHGGLQAGGVQVGHFGLGDLLAVGLGQGGHLCLIGHAGAGLDIARLLDEHGGRGGLGDEGEGAVGVHGNDHGDDQAHVLFGALVELLGKGGDVHAVLAQGGAHGGGRGCLAGGDLQLYISSNFLCHLKQHLLHKMWW